MDSIDRHLLMLLRADARQPLKQLAASVSLASSSVRERIARLRAAGVIRRFTIETATEDAAISAICHLRLVRTPDYGVVDAVSAMREAIRCYALAGDIDLMVELGCSTATELNAARDRIAAIAGVESVTTRLILAREK
jgi:DNA-binding Lrp family transcriptional regulator